MKYLLIALLITSNLYSQKTEYKLSKTDKQIITITGLSTVIYGFSKPYQTKEEFNNKQIICLCGTLFACIPYIEFEKNNKSMEFKPNKITFKYKFKNKKYKCYNEFNNKHLKK